MAKENSKTDSLKAGIVAETDTIGRSAPAGFGFAYDAFRSAHNDAEGGLTTVRPGVTREQIRTAYVLLLDREPESEKAYQAQALCTDLAQLRRVVVNSVEYRFRQRRIIEAQSREALFFFHLEKTGGTTLREVIAMNFTPEKIAPHDPAPYQNKFAYTESTQDFFSGHFDFESVIAIPRAKKKLISMFRSPTERLISRYRFHRGMRLSGNSSVDNDFNLAKKLDPEDYFNHRLIRCSPLVDNYYLRIFGLSLLHENRIDGLGKDLEAFDVAKQRIQGLDALGITERMTESVGLICRTFGFPVPVKFESYNRTDDLPALDSRASPVPPVEKTPRLREALADLTRYDDLLFEAALEEFDRRLLSGPNSENPKTEFVATERRQ